MEISSTSALYQQDPRNQAGAIDTQNQGPKTEVPGTTGGTVTIRSVDASNNVENVADSATRGEEVDRVSKAQATRSTGPVSEAEASGKTETRSGQPMTPEQAQVVDELVARDLEVRIHEQAHAAAGAPYTSAPTYSFQRGPDGQSYAVGGQVNIDTSPIPGDPQATMDKMRVVAAAATAPAEPSGQDLKVAAQAQAAITEASAELAEKNSREDSELTGSAQANKPDSAAAPADKREEAAETDAERDPAASAQALQQTEAQTGMNRKLADIGVIEGTRKGDLFNNQA